MSPGPSIKPPFRFLVTGSRDWDDLEHIWDALNKLNAKLGLREGILVHGDAQGADKQAAVYWEYLGKTRPVLGPRTLEPYPVSSEDWEKFGKGAGHRRNRQMVNSGVSLCLAFIKNNSRGATGCADYAESKGVKVIRFEH